MFILNESVIDMEEIPEIVSRPSAPPKILPVSYAAFPIKIADKTRNAVMNLVIGLRACSRKASPNPFRATIPNRADISCNTTVAIIENNRPHKRAYPNFAPAMEQVVIVPGPINAAVTKAAGPIDLIFFNMLFLFIMFIKNEQEN